MTDDPGLTDLLDVAALSAIQGQVHAPVIGRVIAYTQATERADVQPVVAVLKEGVLTPAPILRSVPIAFPRWATGSITWPLAVGDLVQLVPQDVDQSLYVTAGTPGQAAPTPRRWSWTDVIGIPIGIKPSNGPPSTASYSPNGPVIDGTLVYLGPSTATDFVALAQKVLDADQAVYTHALTHVHSVVCPSGGGTVLSAAANPTSPPLPATPSSAASSKVHAI